MKPGTRIVRNDVDRKRALHDIARLRLEGAAYAVTIRQYVPSITAKQIAKVHALCADVAKHLKFPGGGWASGEAWYKFLVGLYRGERLVREGEVVVVIGGGLSELTRVEASDLITFIEQFGAERGVVFSR